MRVHVQHCDWSAWGIFLDRREGYELTLFIMIGRRNLALCWGNGARYDWDWDD